MFYILPHFPPFVNHFLPHKPPPRSYCRLQPATRASGNIAPTHFMGTLQANMTNFGAKPMTIKQPLAILIGLLYLLILPACTPPEPAVPAQNLPVPLGHYGDVLHFPNGELFIQSGLLDTTKQNNLRYYQLSTDQFVELTIPDDPRCRLTEFTIPTALPDGRLGLSELCYDYWSDRPIGQTDARFLIAYDWETEEVEQIVEEPLLSLSSTFSWNPTMTRGVQGSSSLPATISWLTPTGTEPMTITIGTGEQAWSLARDLPTILNGVGTARQPTWSPDGRSIAFWASTNVIHRPGYTNARVLYSLYLLDTDTLQLQTILDDAKNTTPIAWSPDSQWLAFVADIGSTRGTLWLRSADGATRQFIDAGLNFGPGRAFNGLDWLNEQAIIATKCLDENCHRADVIQYNVSAIVTPLQE
jgi:hypothetical protein